MNNKQYAQYCRLQEAIRNYGFPQIYDEMLARAVKHDPPHFTMNVLDIGPYGRLRYDLRIYKLDGSDDYTFDHYRLTCRNDMPIRQEIINGIDTRELDEKMQQIDWPVISAQVLTDDLYKGPGRLYIEVMDIIEDLEKLSDHVRGIHAKDMLMAKHLSCTPLVVQTPLQLRLNQIERPFCEFVMVSVRQANAPIMQDAPAILATKPADRRNYMQDHEVFEVRMRGYENRSSTEVTVGTYKEESRYLTSLKGAVDFVERINPECFNPITVFTDRLDRMLKDAVIYDCLDDRIVAAKYGSWNLNRKESLTDNKVCWRLREDKIPLKDFENKSGLLLSSYGHPGKDHNVFQVMPALPPTGRKQQQYKPLGRDVRRRKRRKGPS